MGKLNWEVADKVIIVEPHMEDTLQVNRSYIADYKSRSSIESAISRASSRSYLNDFCYLSGVEHLPNEYLVDNKFTLDITTYYSKSMYKGEYIDVRCELTDTNNKTYIVHIELGSLLSLLHNDNFKLRETKVKLGRSSGLVGVFIENEEIVKIGGEKKSEPKTSVYEVGQLYKVGYRKKVYWGEVYCWIDTRYINIQNIGREYINIADLKILDEPTKLYIMSDYKVHKGLKDFKDILTYAKNDLNLVSGYKEIINNLYDSIYKNRTPRVKLSGAIDSKDNLQTLDEILYEIRKYMLSNKPKNRQLITTGALYPFFITTDIKNKPNYSDEEFRKIISIAKG